MRTLSRRCIGQQLAETHSPAAIFRKRGFLASRITVRLRLSTRCDSSDITDGLPAELAERLDKLLTDAGRWSTERTNAVNAKTYWQKLKKIGWLDYLPEDLHDDVRSQLETNLKDKEEPQFVCMALALGGFEAGSTDGKSVLQELARASRGVFRPTRINITPVKKDPPFELSIQHDKKKFSCLISSEFDNLPSPDYENILNLANQSLKATAAQERFFALPVVDVFFNLVFVPPSVYKAAVKEKLILPEVVYTREDAFYFNDLAWYYAASSFADSRNGKLAVKEAKKAVALDPTNHEYMEGLAAAYAEMGKFKEAVQWQERAMRRGKSQDIDAKQRLELYRKNQPYRFPPTPEPPTWPESMSSSIK
jgi:tetratricopeptide (TPR) repeat protein